MLNIFKILNATYQDINSFNFDNIDPQIIRYYRTEFGASWKEALNNHLEENKRKNDKEAA